MAELIAYPTFIACANRFPAVSPIVVAQIFIIQKLTVIIGKLFTIILCLAIFISFKCKRLHWWHQSLLSIFYSKPSLFFARVSMCNISFYYAGQCFFKKIDRRNIYKANYFVDDYSVSINSGSNGVIVKFPL